MGEGWHNNHHAFPGSARIGLYRGQVDPGWLFIQALASLGLAWDIRTPDQLGPRPELRALVEQGPGSKTQSSSLVKVRACKSSS